MDIRKRIGIWLERLVNVLFYLAVSAVAWIVLQVFVVTSFRIPSDSMLPVLHPGDAILVDKCSKGARLFDVSKALNREKIKIRRMPGWREYRRNDVLVFNFPYQEGRWDSIGFDVMKYYVKRCVGLPGDTLEIRGGYYKIRGVQEAVGYLPAQRRMAVLPDSGTMVVIPSFPWDKEMGWTVKEFGPLPIPAKGQVVKMDATGWRLYRQLIGWEQECRVHLDDAGRVALGDSVIEEYRFRENYYFMAGDNAYNSQDSRYWGLLPEPFIVGRAVRVWKSVDRNTGKMRWERMFKKIE